MHDNAADWFVDRHVREGRGDRPAFIDEHGTLSYAALQAESARFAAGLVAGRHPAGSADRPAAA